MQQFIDELKILCEKYSVALIGRIKLEKFDDFLSETLQYSLPDVVEFGGIKDKSGKYLVGIMERKPEPIHEFKPVKLGGAIIDYEKPMEGGFHSPADGKYYSRRRDYENSLKENGVHVVSDSRERTAEKRQRAIEERKAFEKESSNFAWI
jgi:hypothetical protein